MATKYELRTFQQIVDSVMALLKLQSSDTVSANRIRQDINRAYLNEIIPYTSWPFKRKKVQLQIPAYHGTGTASVTQNSVTVTLTTSLTTSRTGYLFSINGENDTYLIKSHTAGTATLTLEAPYTGNTNSSASFKIYSESIPLPADLEEITEITHPNMGRPMQGVGIQEFRRIQAAAPKAEGRAFYYSLNDYADPSPYSSVSSLPATATRSSAGLVKTIKFNATLGADTSTSYLRVGDRIRVASAGNYTYNIDAIVASITTTTNANDTITYTALAALDESSTADTGISITKLNSEGYERQRQLLIYPCIYNAATNIYVDYEQQVPILEESTDEPILPMADRVVLFWLALSYAYARERNVEESLTYRQLAEQRLGRMAGRTTESIDKPALIPSKNYLATKRNMNRHRHLATGLEDGFGGGGSSTNPLGNTNTVAIFGSDQTLQSDSLISTTELHALEGIDSAQTIEQRLDALEGTLTTVTLSDNQASATNVLTFSTSTYTAGQIKLSISRSTAREYLVARFITDGSSISYDISGPIIGTSGITLTMDISGSDARLRYTSTSTGSSGTLKYRLSTTEAWTA